MFLRIKRYAVIALSFLGSATLLFSCGKKTQITAYDNETLMTESSEHRAITMMENGKRSYTFVSPLMEGYRLAANPYQEFRRGIELTTYTDSLSLPEVTITANYAIYYERQKLWEAKGNVVVIRRNREEGDTTITGLTEVYTQQLFWNATTKKIYSNVDTKVLQGDGWHFGVGFDADEDLTNIHFRRYSSEIEFDVSQTEQSDTTKRKSLDERIQDSKSSAEQEEKPSQNRKPDPDNRVKGGDTRPNFAAPKQVDGNIVKPSDMPKRPGAMQLEEGGQKPLSRVANGDMRPDGRPMRDAAKQAAEGVKSLKPNDNRELPKSATKQ